MPPRPLAWSTMPDNTHGGVHDIVNDREAPIDFAHALLSLGVPVEPVSADSAAMHKTYTAPILPIAAQTQPIASIPEVPEGLSHTCCAYFTPAEGVFAAPQKKTMVSINDDEHKEEEHNKEERKNAVESRVQQQTVPCASTELFGKDYCPHKVTFEANSKGVHAQTKWCQRCKGGRHLVRKVDCRLLCNYETHTNAINQANKYNGTETRYAFGGNVQNREEHDSVFGKNAQCVVHNCHRPADKSRGVLVLFDPKFKIPAAPNGQSHEDLREVPTDLCDQEYSGMVALRFAYAHLCFEKLHPNNRRGPKKRKREQP